MLIIPAIDILGGKCVRLHQGNYSQKTEYSADPVSVAQQWVDQGAEFLHIVDLDGAKEGKPINLDIVANIVSSITIPVELGGGIRDIKTIDSVLSKGVTQVVLGTVAYQEPDFIREACLLYPNKIVVGIDGKNGKVAVKGWIQLTELPVIELSKQLSDSGIKTFIYTDISRDGTLEGPNLQGLAEFAKNSKVGVIASGGVSNLKDIVNIKKLKLSNINGIIIGKALYDGRINLRDAIQISSQ